MAGISEARRRSVRFRPDTVFFPSAKEWHCMELIFRRQTEPFWYFRERLACLTMRNRVLSPFTEYKVVWDASSRQPFCFGLDRRLYIDNHERSYLLDGLSQEPQLLYQHPHVAKQCKIITVMQYFVHLRHPHPTREEQSTVALVLTEDGWVKAFDADTGELLRSIFLSRSIKFRYLSWAEYLYSVQVKSVKHTHHPLGQEPRRLNHAGGAAAATDLAHFVIFDIHPLRLHASFKIDKQVFGSDVTDASIDGNVLIVVHGGRSFWFYSLKELVKMNTTTLPIIGERQGDVTVGEFPLGIPLTMDIKELPPVLLRVVSSPENAVSFGGHPFHYLHNPHPKKASYYCLRSVAGNELVYCFTSDYIAVSPDVVEFHFDDHQRLLHIASTRVSCFSFDTTTTSASCLKLMYSIDFQDLSQHQKDRSHDCHVTRSGRIVKRVNSYENSLDSQCIIHEVDYENELDLVYVVVSVPSGEDGCYDTSIVFINDWNGEILKKVPLPTWDEVDVSNSVHLELSSIIHQRHLPSSKYSCYVYALKTIALAS